MTSYDILVIILSVMLAFALLLVILTLLAIRKIVSKIDGVVDKASGLVENAEAAAAVFAQQAKRASTVAILKNIISMVRGNDGKK